MEEETLPDSPDAEGNVEDARQSWKRRSSTVRFQVKASSTAGEDSTILVQNPSFHEDDIQEVLEEEEEEEVHGDDEEGDKVEELQGSQVHSMRKLPTSLGSRWNILQGQFTKQIRRQATGSTRMKLIDVVGICNAISLDEEEGEEGEGTTGEGAQNEQEGAHKEEANLSMAGTESELFLSKHSTLREYTMNRINASTRLRNHPSILAAIEDIWWIQDLQDALDNEQCLSRDPYVNLLVKFQYVIVPPPLRLTKAIRNAEVDWVNDTKGETKMTKTMFEDAMFQIADTWSVETDAAEYCEILSTLLEGVTKVLSGDAVPSIHMKDNSESLLASKGRRRRTLIRNNKHINYNPLFGANADKKFDGFKKIFAQTYGKSKAPTNKLPRASTYQAIGKLYQAKFESDAKNAQKGLPRLRFDKFIFEQYIMQYGSRKMAKRHLKRLFATVRDLAEQGEPAMRMFALLAGIEVAPFEESVCITEYDPFLVSDYFLPTMCRLVDDGKQLAPTFAQSYKTSEALCTLAPTFQATMRDVCTRTPRDAFFFKELAQQLQQCVVKVKSTDVSSSMRKNHVKVMQIDRRLSEILGEKGILGGVRQNLWIDVNQALLHALQLWQADKKWNILYRYILCGKVIANWTRFCHNKCKGMAGDPNKIVIPRSISILSSADLHDNRVLQSSFASIATLNAAAEIVERVSGQNLRTALTFTSKSQLLQQFGPEELLFKPSPRTPRKILEEARKLDKELNQ